MKRFYAVIVFVGLGLLGNYFYYDQDHSRAPIKGQSKDIFPGIFKQDDESEAVSEKATSVTRCVTADGEIYFTDQPVDEPCMTIEKVNISDPIIIPALDVNGAGPGKVASYRCDGRKYCSQMKSCEEATYFINHCPQVKMDGDGDGIPCESQWCN